MGAGQCLLPPQGPAGDAAEREIFKETEQNHCREDESRSSLSQD